MKNPNIEKLSIYDPIDGMNIVDVNAESLSVVDECLANLIFGNGTTTASRKLVCSRVPSRHNYFRVPFS